jgi:DNA polymerase III gamma/tau subunit
MATDLPNKYRPQKLRDLVGQEKVVETLRGYLAGDGLPHCLLLEGPSGTGKTTTARILQQSLDCATSDFTEINCAGKDGPDQIREIPDHVSLAALASSRIWYLDEFQSLSRAGFCQQSLLKVLEDTDDYPDAYFLIATTDPSKILKTILTRCVRLVFDPVRIEALVGLIVSVAEREGKKLAEGVAEGIAERADGSPRQALHLLGGVLDRDLSEQLETLQALDAEKKAAFDLAKALLWEKPDARKVLDIVAALKDADVEGVRQTVLSCVTKELLKCGKKDRMLAALAVHRAFQFDFDRNRYNGLVGAVAGLVFGG